jgi:hypothetical protein
MKSSEVRRPRVSIALIALAAAGLVYLDAQSSAGGTVAQEGSPVSSVSSDKRGEAETAIFDARLPRELRSALGSAFGGVWFEPSTAQLHVGVTSASSREEADEVAAQAGLGGAVTATPVSLTWAQLEATQERWNRRLADLFAREEVKTSLLPDRNSVKVELGASVPAWRQVALRQAADAAGAAVSLVTSPLPRFHIDLEARCKAFAVDKAHCETPLVAGVSTISEKVGTERQICTAGPPVVRKNPTTAATRTEVFMLTAGHCMKAGGGEKGWWSAWTKEKEVETLIGKGVTYLYPTTDVGVVTIGNPGHWTLEGSTPVNPTLAWWEAEESEPLNITGEEMPMTGAEVCVSGQSSGTSCGEITGVGVASGETKNLFEVKGATTTIGDSGAPWFLKGSPSAVVGVHQGKDNSGKNPVFHSLETSFKELKAEKGLDLELLTKGEEIRHPTFTGDKYPVEVSAEDTTSEDQFTAFGNSMSCVENEFSGEVTEADQTEAPTVFEMTPVYKSCTTTGGLPVTLANNGCTYKFSLKERVAEDNYNAEVDVVCPAEKPGMQFNIYLDETSLTSGSAMCVLTVPPQSGLEGLTLTNSAGDIVVDEDLLEGIKVKIHRNGFFCPSSGTENETASGVYHIGEAITASGASGEEAIDIDMAGE